MPTRRRRRSVRAWPKTMEPESSCRVSVRSASTTASASVWPMASRYSCPSTSSVAASSYSVTTVTSKEGRESVWPTCRINVFGSSATLNQASPTPRASKRHGGQLDLPPRRVGAAASEEIATRDQLIVAHVGQRQFVGDQRCQFRLPVGIGQRDRFDRETHVNLLTLTAHRIEIHRANLVDMTTAVEVIQELGYLGQVTASAYRETEPFVEFDGPLRAREGFGHRHRLSGIDTGPFQTRLLSQLEQPGLVPRASHFGIPRE